MKEEKAGTIAKDNTQRPFRAWINKVAIIPQMPYEEKLIRLWDDFVRS